MNVTVPVPHRQGWTFGDLITDAPLDMRRGALHAASGYGFWVFGESVEEITITAQEQIDLIYCRKWAEMTELIDQGDFHGPNVWRKIESQGGYGPTFTI